MIQLLSAHFAHAVGIKFSLSVLVFSRLELIFSGLKNILIQVLSAHLAQAVGIKSSPAKKISCLERVSHGAAEAIPG